MAVQLLRDSWSVRGKETGMTVKEELHELVEALPESELLTAQRFLRHLNIMAKDPVMKALMSAPLEDEVITEEEEAQVREAEEELARGEGIPLDVVIERMRQAS
jgi:hypothetical protein